MAYQKTACLPIPFIAKSPGVLYGNGLLQDTKQYSQWFYFPAIEISSKAMISNLNYPPVVTKSATQSKPLTAFPN